MEAIAATDAIVDRARAVTAEPELTMEQAVDRARGGDPELLEVFATAGKAIGLGLAALVNLFGPERVVVSGEGLETFDLFDSTSAPPSSPRRSAAPAAACWYSGRFRSNSGRGVPPRSRCGA